MKRNRKQKNEPMKQTLPPSKIKLFIKPAVFLKCIIAWFCLLAFVQTKTFAYTPAATITGRITGDSSQPLSGVAVQVKGTTRGTTTNEQGSFTIEASPSDVLVVSYVGYASKEVTVGNQTTISVVLTTAGQELQQVVVVGYGTQRKLDVTGSVAQVSSAEINKQPTPNPVSALQGKVAGVQITNSGAPGASPQIRIRGLGTVYGNPNPLYVVDGVWYDDISFLNPADIDNISILKDASSESIYGIRAANGVVLVTTKKGRNGQPSVNYNGYVGFQSVTNQVKMANATEYANLVNEKNIYSGGDTLLHNPSQYGAGTDWYDVILRNALVTNHQVSVSGATEKSSYNFSLGYYDQQGIVKTNDFKRYTARIQNDIQVLRPLKIGYTVIGTHIQSNDISGTIFNQTFNAPAVIPVHYADGSYGDPGDFGLGVAVANPQVNLDYFSQKSITNRITGNVYADLKIAQHFTYHFSMGGEYGSGQVTGYTPVYNATSTQNNSTSSLAVTRTDTRNWIIENTLSYTNRFNDHNVTVLVGQGSQRNQYNELHASVQNISDTAALQFLSLGTANTARVYDLDPTNPLNPAYPLLSTINSYFGRVNYSFKNRYLLNASFRADGSSKFSGNNRWGYFPSVGAGWIISEEPFMKNQKVFNNLKIRGSWGKVGNANVPLNLSVLRVTQTPQLTAIFGGQPYTGASINTIVTPTTYWELSQGADVGLEASVIDRRLSIEADYYNRKTKNAIFDIPVLASLGTSSGTIIGNQATFQNEGFEFTATWRDNASKNFTYSISGNIGINNNKVLSAVTGENPIYAGGGASTGGALATRTVVGGPIGEFFGRQVIGVFQSTADITSYTSKSGTVIQPDARPGDFKYADVNGDGQITDQDRVVLGNPNPKYTYGINTSFRYKDFDLSLDFQGVAKADIFNAVNALRYGNENYTKDFYDHRWHGEGTSNSYPSADIGGGKNYLPNSFFVQSGSYFRVRNAQLGYNLPSALMNRWHTRALRVYINAQNPLNFFKYKGFSPEVGGTPTNAGIDTNVYPLYATYNFGVNLTF